MDKKKEYNSTALSFVDNRMGRELTLHISAFWCVMKDIKN